jgi:succinyl-diaminopimelate desuccinylase
LAVVAAYEPRVVEIDGVNFTEQIQAVRVDGGVANNVVPDEATVTLNLRIAPDRDRAATATALEEMLRGVLGDGDELEIADYAPPAPPSRDEDVIARLIEASATEPRAKVGWTDVATFHERGVPAVNFGAGDPLLAHRSDEQITREELEEFDRVLRSVLRAV